MGQGNAARKIEVKTICVLEYKKVKPQALVVLLESQTPSPSSHSGDRLLAAIARRIGKSLNLEEILNTTVSEVRQLLGCDRVIIYRFKQDWSGEIVVESVASNWTSVLGITIKDPCFTENYVDLYKNGRILAIADIYRAGIARCHIDLLAYFQVQANLVVPIAQNSPDKEKKSANKLWGLLGAHQCSSSRQWQESEIELVKSLATHVAIAIQQSELYQQLKTELAERKRMQVALQHSEERFRNLVETTSDWVWEIDENAVYTYVSPKVRDILGYEPAEMVGKTPFNFMSWSEAARVAKIFAEIALSQLPLSCLEHTQRHQDGREVLLETSGVPFFDLNGTFRGYRGIARDISERQRAAAALQQAHQRLTFHVENSPLAVVEWDNKFRIQRWSGQAEKIFGWNVSEVLGKHFTEWPFVYDADRKAFTEVMARLIDGSQPRNISRNRNLTSTGAVVHCEWYNSALRDSNGNLVSILSLVLDVTERQLAVDALQKANEQLEMRVEERTAQIRQTNQQLRSEISQRQRAQEALQVTQFTVDRAAEAVFWIGSDGRLLYANEAACQLLGYDREELLGMTISEIEANYPAEVWAQRWTLLKEKQSLTFESNYKRQDGRFLSVEITANYLEFKGEEYQCAFVRDIAERKRAEVEVLKALKTERELSQLKSRIVSVVNHEYRTPLTTILSSAENLEYYGHKWTDEKKLQYLHRIKAAVNHLTQLVDDVLIINKADSEQLEFNPKPIDLVSFCQYLTEELQATTQENQQLRFEFQGNCPQAVVDEKLLRQLLTNLLTNAIKYNPNGGQINLELICQSPENCQQGKKKMVIFRIQDRGIGIPQEDRGRLFKSFHRGHNVGSITGTGLGLAIVKKAVDLHGGDISFTSEVGVGTTFIVRLPVGSDACE